MAANSIAVSASPGGAYLVWEDLVAVLPNHGSSKAPRKLLHGLSGYALPGRIMALLGPSGSGKSTLLDSLAGRVGKNVVLTGKVLLNGHKRRLNYGIVAYVTQEDLLLGTLTVRETITYSAHLRLPANMTRKKVQAVVENTIQDMGLEDCADRVIGNWHLRGISGGERKRLSIALEILTQPHLLFLDEPTSGLDSAAAFFVIQMLRQMAKDNNMTIISSIHQPSSEVFALFDDLYLLSSGETVYFGDAQLATKFFAEAGFPCPSKRNPSDHFLRCVNSDFDQVNATLMGSLKHRVVTVSSSDPLSNFKTSEVKVILVERYKNSEYAMMAGRKINEITQIYIAPFLLTCSLKPASSFHYMLWKCICLTALWILSKQQCYISGGADRRIKKGSQASWWKQLRTLTKRSFVNMSRDVGYYWLRIAIYTVVSVCIGTIYYDVGTSYTAILARASCGGFISGFLTFMSIGAFPSFIEEMKVFTRERANGHYGVAVYVLSNFLSSFPFLAAVAIVSGSITYPLVKFSKSFSRYTYFTINLYAGISVIESLMMVVAALVPNFLMGIITGAGVIGIMMMTSGFFRLLPELPKPVWRYPISFLSYGSWSLQGAYKNDMTGLVFDPMIPGDPKLTGEYAMQKMLGISLDHSKWLDLMAVFILLLMYRILFFLVLKIKERASPLFRAIYARITVENALRRPSFKKKPSFSSQYQYHPSHPMAIQEGLNSPLP